MANFVKKMEELPRIWKLVLCIPVLNILWTVWRFIKSIQRNNTIELICAVVWVFLGSTVLWILDIVFIILGNYPFWFK